MSTALFTKPRAGKLSPTKNKPGRDAYRVANRQLRDEVDRSLRDLQMRRAMRDEGRASR